MVVGDHHFRKPPYSSSKMPFRGSQNSCCLSRPGQVVAGFYLAYLSIRDAQQTQWNGHGPRAQGVPGVLNSTGGMKEDVSVGIHSFFEST